MTKKDFELDWYEYFERFAERDPNLSKVLRDHKETAQDYAQEKLENLRKNREHEKLVRQAINEGKAVPDEVLIDYPDLRG